MVGRPKKRAIDFNIPEFMRSEAGKGSENIRYEDTGWYIESKEKSNMSKTSKIKAMSDKNFTTNDNDSVEIRPLIDSILLAIILANGPINDASARLVAAKVSLKLDKQKLDRRRRPEVIDDASLRKIAARYHQAVYADITRNVDIEAIIWQVIEEEKKPSEKTLPLHHQKFERLKLKFRRRREFYLSGVNAEDTWPRVSEISAVRRILKDLQTLGVKTDVSQLDPVLRQSASHEVR